jgi:hypothetical protein
MSYSKQACGDGLPRKPSMVANCAIVKKYKIKELLWRKQRQKKIKIGATKLKYNKNYLQKLIILKRKF